VLGKGIKLLCKYAWISHSDQKVGTFQWGYIKLLILTQA